MKVTICESSEGKSNTFDELKLIHDTMLNIWSMYIKWFTWFFFSELLTISWFVSAGIGKSVPDAEFKKNAMLILGSLWIFGSILGIIMSVKMKKYATSTHARVAYILEKESTEHLGSRIAAISPYIATSWAAIGSMLGLSGGVVAWILILILSRIS
ncbi:hypothetical protein GGE65_006209 [Skermanella aerolata]|uniref:hypothetical protein n=1 Tax=Skermanella aerolata TaxID=393310 RepID=UPI003D1D2376